MDGKANLIGCEISKTNDGRIGLLEHFQWESREGTGTNVFEEIT